MLAPRDRLRTTRLVGYLSLLSLLLLWQREDALPSSLQPACEAESAQPLVRAFAEQRLAEEADPRIELGTVPLAAVNTTPVLQGAIGPTGCLRSCLLGRLYLQHCVVRREVVLVDSVLSGLDSVRLEQLSLHSSCEWWEVIGGDEGVPLNATLALAASGVVALEGAVVEVARCFVGGEEAVPPEGESLLSRETLASARNLRVRLSAAVLVDGCTVREAKISRLSVDFDAVATDVPAVHTLAPLVLGSGWVREKLVRALTARLNGMLGRRLPFDAASSC